MQVSVRPVWVLAAAAVGAAALWVWWRGGSRSAGEAIGSAVVEAANGIVGGVVQEVGAVVGIPKTNQTECEKAIAEGRTWDASFACPAGDFIKYVLR